MTVTTVTTNNEPTTKQLLVSIDEASHRALRSKASREGMTNSEAVEAAIAVWAPEDLAMVERPQAADTAA